MTIIDIEGRTVAEVITELERCDPTDIVHCPATSGGPSWIEVEEAEEN